MSAQNMSIKDYFEYAFGQQLTPDSSGEVAVRCPWHNDSVESMSINLNTGLWTCFGCGLKGDIYTFVQLYEDTDFKGACKWLSDHGFVGDVEIELVDDESPKKPKLITKRPKKKLPPISDIVIDGLVDNLWCNSAVLDFLHNKRGFTDDTIRQFRLGYHNGRITIPLFNEEGCYNIRQYDWAKRDSSKVISWERGRGGVTLFPDPSLWSDDPIFLCEGEMDCILMHQLGFNAVTSTSGAGNWKPEWNQLFHSREVNICYDIDKAGQNGMVNVANNLEHIASSVRILNLPISEPSNGDVTDWVVGYGATRDDFQHLIDKTVPRNTLQDEDDNEVYDVPLHEASLAKYAGKRIRTAAVVAGKDLEPYIVPDRYVVRCASANKKKCTVCPIGIAGGTLEVNIPKDSPNLMKLRGLSDSVQRTKMKEFAGALGDCTVDLDVIDNVNIEDLVLIPELSWNDENQSYVTRHVSIVDHGIQAGKSYVFTGITVPDSSTQHATHLFYDKEWSEDDISSFEMSDNLKNELSVFQPAEGQTVRQKMDEIIRDLSTNVTSIYGRNDVHIAVDLAYHSLLRFDFDGKPLKRGWLEVLLFGDTRTGKTETVQQLMRHYRLGEFVTGEASSYAGLVGGLQQVNKRWQITWGKIPLNDRRLVVIDEASGLTQDEIANMSGIRSSGVAEITKIQTERALARTRLIWISNPRYGDNVSSRTYPVEFIPQLIGKAEDISRFDLVVSSASEDVDSKVINSNTPEEVPHVYTSELCHNLIMWVWSRRPEDVLFSKQARKLIYELSVKMGEGYTSEIPLVESADFRVKLARMAAAWAARLFSTDDGNRLLVKKEHVEAAAQFVDECYKKSSFRYKQFSEARAKENEPLGASRDDVIKWLEDEPLVFQFLSSYDEFKRQDIEDFCGMTREDSANITRYLSSHRLVRLSRGTLRKTPMFIKLLEEMRNQ